MKGVIVVYLESINKINTFKSDNYNIIYEF